MSESDAAGGANERDNAAGLSASTPSPAPLTLFGAVWQPCTSAAEATAWAATWAERGYESGSLPYAVGAWWWAWARPGPAPEAPAPALFEGLSS
jgi:hypothetical protein